MNYKQGFISGLLISVIVTIFSPLNQWSISEIITPEYFNNVIEYTLKRGYYETIAKAEAQFNLKNYIIQSRIWALSMGVITSAIVPIFVRGKA